MATQLNTSLLSQLDVFGASKNIELFNARGRQVKDILLSTLAIIQEIPDDSPVNAVPALLKAKTIFDALVSLLNQLSAKIIDSGVPIADTVAAAMIPSMLTLQQAAIELANDVEKLTGRRPANSTKVLDVTHPKDAWGLLQWGLLAGGVYLGVRYIAYPILRASLGNRRRQPAAHDWN